jgi:hypothetical protein
VYVLICDSGNETGVSKASPSRIMRLCDCIILRIICIFHYVRIIEQGAHNLRIIAFHLLGN